MNPHHVVCNYALLRFLPYRETEEFVNVGVVLECQQAAMLEFRLAASRVFPRVKAFFPEQDDDLFTAAHEAMAREFERVRQQVGRNPKGTRRAFQELVRPRESTFRFGEVRTIAASDPARLAEELFERYVMRFSEPATAASND